RGYAGSPRDGLIVQVLRNARFSEAIAHVRKQAGFVSTQTIVFGRRDYHGAHWDYRGGHFVFGGRLLPIRRGSNCHRKNGRRVDPSRFQIWTDWSGWTRPMDHRE